jgi:hypothetical protein
VRLAAPERRRDPGVEGRGRQGHGVFGGARLGQSLIRERLVDELLLTVYPVAPGEGLHCWQASRNRSASNWSAPPPTRTDRSPRSYGRAERGRGQREPGTRSGYDSVIYVGGWSSPRLRGRDLTRVKGSSIRESNLPLNRHFLRQPTRSGLRAPCWHSSRSGPRRPRRRSG